MRLLLDTHVAVWAVTDSERLGREARRLIEDHPFAPAVSVATIWEIAIKFALGRSRPNAMPFSGRDATAEFEKARYRILPVTAAHATVVDDLPLLHGDPFDRMLVAQARAEGMTLLTRDARLAGYGGWVMVV